jgi:hypothetical protein
LLSAADREKLAASFASHFVATVDVFKLFSYFLLIRSLTELYVLLASIPR